MNGTQALGLFMGTLCLFGLVALIGYSIYIDYQYESQIGAYFDNAEDCITPDCILIQLNSGYDAIKQSGLTNDDYGAWIFKKPSNKMEFQYQHLDAIIERANSVQDWVDKVYANNSQAEVMKDVYTEKMDNLRGYVTGETMTGKVGSRSDWIAKDSWYLKYHFFMEILAFPFGLLLFILMIIFYALVGVGGNSYGY